MALIARLMARPDHVLPRPQLVDAIWGNNIHVSDRTLDSHLRNLRAKLAAAGCGDAVETLHGVGVRMGPCRGAQGVGVPGPVMGRASGQLTGAQDRGAGRGRRTGAQGRGAGRGARRGRKTGVQDRGAWQGRMAGSPAGRVKRLCQGHDGGMTGASWGA